MCKGTFSIDSETQRIAPIDLAYNFRLDIPAAEKVFTLQQHVPFTVLVSWVDSSIVLLHLFVTCLTMLEIMSISYHFDLVNIFTFYKSFEIED